jgi:hypothetical protein
MAFNVDVFESLHISSRIKAIVGSSKFLVIPRKEVYNFQIFQIWLFRNQVVLCWK